MSGIVPQPAYVNLQIGQRGGDNADPELADDVTAFWLADNPSGLPNLVGMYLLLGGQAPDPTSNTPTLDPIDGRIVLVTHQSGKMVQVQLQQKQRNPRIKKQQVNYNHDPKIKEAFESTLERLLTGRETDEQINALANTIPRDLSPKIWNILSGGYNTIYIGLKNTTTYPAGVIQPSPNIDYIKSSFTLLYNNEEITDEIFFTDSASVIQKKILDSTLSIDKNDITVTIDNYWISTSGTSIWKTLKIKYNGLMRPLSINDKNIINSADANQGEVSIKKETSEPTGCIIKFNRDCLKSGYQLKVVGKYNTGPVDDEKNNVTGAANYAPPVLILYYRGFKVPFDPTITTASELQALVEGLDPTFAGAITVTSVDEDGDTVGDTDLLVADFNIDCNDGFTSIFVDPSQLQYRSFHISTTDGVALGYQKIRKDALINEFNVPNINVEMVGGGAHEYTNNRRQTMLQNMVSKHTNSPGIQKYRNRIRELLKELKDAEPGAAPDIGAKQAIQDAMTAYRAMAKSADQSTFVDDEAYKLISDTEYGLLYDMEMAGYTEWLNSFNDIDQEFTDDIDYVFTALDIVYIKEACTVILPRWTQRLNLDPQYTDDQRIINGDLTEEDVLYETYLLPNSTTAWLANVGDTITLAGGFQEKYVCSIIPGTIIAVYASKTVGNVDRLIPIPTRYYTKTDMSGATGVATTDKNTYSNCIQVIDQKYFEDFGLYHGTAITLVKPLNQIDPTWSDKLYVTMQSCVGPNVCDILSWVIYTYTNLTLDLTTFQHVHGLQLNYPMNFVLTSKTNVISFCEELAWQARCTLWMKEGVVYIRYLPEEPTSIRTLTLDDIEQASIELTYTTTEELITKLTTTWKATGAQEQPYTTIVRRNLTRYNEVADTREMYAYNNRNLVWKSTTWWAIRRGSTWRVLKCKLFMNNIDLETQDCVTFSLGNLVTQGDIKGILTKCNFNSSDFSIDIEAWLPVLAGQQTQYQFAWPFNVQTLWPLPSDLAGGDAGSINIINGGQVTSNLGGGQLNLPYDVGNLNVGDTHDTMPDDPSKAFDEIDYEDITSTPLEIENNLNADVADDNGPEHPVIDEALRTQLKTFLNGGDNIEELHHKGNGARYLAVTGEQLEIYHSKDDHGNFTIETPYTKGDLYRVVVDEGWGYFVAKSVNHDVNKVLPFGTKVQVYEMNGRLCFEVMGASTPEEDSDETGQPLDPGFDTPTGGFGFF
jgi:hypothetical protein